MKTSFQKIFTLCLIAFLASGVVSCKNSKKHNKKPSCDAECEAQKERERLEKEKGAANNELGIHMTLDGLDVNATIGMNYTDSVPIAILGDYNSAESVIGLMKGPNLGMSLFFPNLQTSSLPGGTYPITILVRDRAKCKAANGADCDIQLDSQGRFQTQVQISSAYDAQFNFTILINNGTAGGGTNDPNDPNSSGQLPWNPPGFQNNPNPSFFGKVGDNLLYGVNWVWVWIKGFGNNP